MKKIKVVCFGGGTGLPTLLAGLKKNPWLEISAIVTMFDTGGSSGELKDKFGILPPGDILKCLLALSKDEKFTREIFLKRIANHSSPGHTGGNILLLGLEKVFGNMTAAIDALGQMVSASGKVLPVTLTHSTLCAEFEDGSIASGETSIDMGVFEGKKVKKLFLDPPVKCNEEALKEIKKADIICVGPGSFFTSVMPNVIPLKASTAVYESKAPIIFIANLMTEGYGMKDWTIEKVVDFFELHINRKVAKIILNENFPKDRLAEYAAQRKYPLLHKEGAPKNDKYVMVELWTDPELARHDQDRLAHIVSNLIYELTQK